MNKSQKNYLEFVVLMEDCNERRVCTDQDSWDLMLAVSVGLWGTDHDYIDDNQKDRYCPN
jgi:hypothetical protein